MGTTARKMVNIGIDETSGVDHPAHLSEGWLVVKSAGTPDVEDVIDASLTEEGSDMADEKTVEAPENEVEKSADEVATLKARIAELEKQVADAKSEDKAEGAVAKSVDPSEEFLKSAPEAVIQMFESMKKEREEAVETLQKERDAQADKEAIAKAKGWNNLNLNAEQVGPALRKLANIDSSLAKSFETMLESLNSQAESANIFAELGKSVGDEGSASALDTLNSMAKALVESNVETSFAKAVTVVSEKNPELYLRYLNEKKGA